MKRILLLFTLLISTASFAQETLGKYHSSYFEKDYEVSASYSSNNELSVYLDVMGEHTYDKVNFIIEGESITLFTNALAQAEEKFLEWKKIAEENHVTDMSKDLDMAFPRVTVAWYGSKWWFAFRHKLTPRFIVTKNGDSVLVITGKATSSSNEYIDQKYYFALSAKSDFEELLKLLELSNIENKLRSKQNVEDLFK